MSSSTASKLEEFLGLHSAKRMVRQILAGRTELHAVLLYGASGSGKNALAHLIAKTWLCKEPTEDGACGECQACGAFERGNSADYLLIAPEGKSSIISQGAIINEKPGDKDPLPLTTFFRTYPLMSRHRVAHIDCADRMLGPASNALLKTLEEPLPHAKLILTTDTVGALLPTILSRCVGIACESPPADVLRAAFPEATEDELRMSEGAPGRLLHIMHHRQVYANLTEFARSLSSRDPRSGLKASEELRASAEKLERALNCGARAANAEALEWLALFFAREHGVPAEWAQEVAAAHRRILQNGAAGLIFDALLVRMLAGRG